jgi:UDP-N-acetyl-D-mannosaminuronic acid dehydrogenase
VDPWFLIDAAPAETELLGVARRVNDAVPARWVARIGAIAAGRPIGVLGLAYKPDTDDLRAAPAVEIARGLPGDVIAHDPYVRALDGVRIGALDEVLAQPVVALLVAHRGYRSLRSRVRGEAIDCCGGWR